MHVSPHSGLRSRASEASPASAVIGTLVGESTSTEFRLAVKAEAIREQDLVAVDAELRAPDGNASESIRVWAKVTRIERLNPLFPKESGHELADAGVGAFDTVLSLSKEMVTAVCQVLGWEPRTMVAAEAGKLSQLRYPAKPATEAYRPTSPDIARIVVGDLNEPKRRHRALDIAHLANRKDVDVAVDAHAVVTRHLAILAMTGSGKTWAARRVIEQLSEKGYPIVIFDPHGDYSGLSELTHLRDRVRLYHAHFPILGHSRENVLATIEALAGKELADTMHTVFQHLLNAVEHICADDQRRKRTADWLALYLNNPKISQYGIKPNLFLLADIAEAAVKAATDKDDAAKDRISELTAEKELRLASKTAEYIQASIGRIRRAAAALARMEKMNRESGKGTLDLPADCTELVRDGGISVVSLTGYASELQATIYRLVAEAILDGRVSGKLKLPALLILEEGHTFAPGHPETPAEHDAVEVTRQIAQEGRKFGVGLILISQRPGRLDETALSMCNSFIIMRMINPADQRFVRNVIESLGEDDVRLLPDLDKGEALLSGQFISFPVLAKMKAPISRGTKEEGDAFTDLEQVRRQLNAEKTRRENRKDKP